LTILLQNSGLTPADVSGTSGSDGGPQGVTVMLPDAPIWTLVALPPLDVSRKVLGPLTESPPLGRKAARPSDKPPIVTRELERFCTASSRLMLPG